MSLDRTLQRVWYERSPLLLFLALTPLSLVFAVLSAARRFMFRVKVLRSVRITRPVIVVGNITVGGTGKTPLVIWITEFLQSRGFKVGVVLRGYGGTATQWPQEVTPQSSSAAAGDEAVLTASRTAAIVVASPNRVDAARRAVELGADVIVSDDGLQHYRLAHDAQIVVLDAARGVGNGWRLPAGPLRESMSRMQRADLVVMTERGASPARSSRGSPGNSFLATDRLAVARHRIIQAQCIATGERRDLSSFIGTTVHAVAGIGNPDAFFSMLREQGLTLDARALPDHASIAASDIDFPGSSPVMMTEKDAVKCRSLATQRHWAVRLDLRFEDDDAQRLCDLLLRVANASQSTNTESP